MTSMVDKRFTGMNWLYIVNITTIVILLLAILLLIIAYPVINSFTHSQLKTRITVNIDINGMSQFAELYVSQFLTIASTNLRSQTHTFLHQQGRSLVSAHSCWVRRRTVQPLLLRRVRKALPSVLPHYAPFWDVADL
jgi:hypothetical protein